MTNQTHSSSTLIDGIVERQRRGLTLDTLFAMMVALALVFSVIGLRSTSDIPSQSPAADISLSASNPAPGCMGGTGSSDLIC